MYLHEFLILGWRRRTIMIQHLCQKLDIITASFHFCISFHQPLHLHFILEWKKKIIKHVDPTSKQKLSLIQICYQNLQNKQIITCPLANPCLISFVDNISDVFDLFTIEKYNYQHLKIKFRLYAVTLMSTCTPCVQLTPCRHQPV